MISTGTIKRFRSSKTGIGLRGNGIWRVNWAEVKEKGKGKLSSRLVVELVLSSIREHLLYYRFAGTDPLILRLGFFLVYSKSTPVQDSLASISLPS